MRQHPPPEVFRPADTGPQRLELNDPAAVYEELHFRTVILEIPGEHRGIGAPQRDAPALIQSLANDPALTS
jgi:hypothetical protein